MDKVDIATGRAYQTLSSNKSFYEPISPRATKGLPDSENIYVFPSFIPPRDVNLFEEVIFTDWKPLGTSGECMVYKASIPPSLSNNRPVAVKVYSKMSQVNTEEVEILLQLSRHPHIVELIGLYTDVGIVQGAVMEYMEGGSWYDTTQVNIWALQAAEGIAYLHENSILHRDIKPANAGTWPYMAPEVLTNDTLEASNLACASDVFSFAITFWETLYRRKPADPKDADFLSRKRGTNVSRKYWTEKTVNQKWRPDLLEPFPEGYQYFSKMWYDQPEQRMTMLEICWQLRKNMPIERVRERKIWMKEMKKRLEEKLTPDNMEKSYEPISCEQDEIEEAPPKWLRESGFLSEGDSFEDLRSLPDKDEPPFLADIFDEEEREKVRMFLKFGMSIEDRLNYMKNFDLKYSIYEKCEVWLKKKENSTEFIPQLPENVQGLAIDFENAGDIEGLERLVKKYGNIKAKEAFGRWELKNGIVEEKDGDLVEDEPTKELKRSSKTGKKHLPKEEEEQSTKKRSGRSKTHKQFRKRADSAKTHRGKQGNKGDRFSREEEHNLIGRHLHTMLSFSDKDEDEEDAVEDFRPHLDMITNMPDEMNVVILGGTGNGKSTFINAVANLLTRQTLDDACRSPNVLIKTSFHHFDSNGSEKLIEHEPTIPVERQGDGENEDSRTGQSATQSPKSYIFEFGSTGNKKILRLIDTPGVGDVRGIDQDKLNFSKVVNFISSFKKIHAFLFLLKPNEARLDIGFRYGMNELLRHLHASVANNIVFCMSNGKGVSYNPGETYRTLQKYLNGVYDDKQIRIQLDGRYFVFDSIHFRYAAANRYNIKYSPIEIRDFQESWTFGREKLLNMLSMICDFVPHDVKNTLSMNKVCKVIELIARPLAEIAKNQLENMNIIERKRKKIEDRLANNEDLRGRLCIEQVHMTTEGLDQPVTVCTHGECVVRVPLHPNGAEEIVYIQECHKACYLLNLLPGEMPNENIKKCEIFADSLDENKCTKCGHGYEVHMHLRHRLVRRVERFIDRNIEQTLEMNANQVEIARQFIADREEQRLAYQRDLEKKQEYCAHFAIFLQKNSVFHYNDQYLAFLTNMIREEEQSYRVGGNDEILEKLKNARAQYMEIVKVFEQTALQEGKAKSIYEIEAMIEELTNMDNGEVVRDKLEWFETNAYVDMDPVIQVNNQNFFKIRRGQVKETYYI